MDEQTRKAWEASPFGQLLARAEAEKAKKREQGRENREIRLTYEDVWGYSESFDRPTENEAFMNLRKAEIPYEVKKRQAEGVFTDAEMGKAWRVLHTYFRGIDWNHLQLKAKEDEKQADRVDSFWVALQKRKERMKKTQNMGIFDTRRIKKKGA